VTSFSTLTKNSYGLGKFTRGIYNAANRRVEADVAKIFSGSIDYEDLSRGAIPLAIATDELKAAIRQGWLWSNWAEEKSLLVRMASMLGDVAIKIVDEPDKEKVRMEVVHPGKIHDVEFNSVGDVKSAVIEYERMGNDGKYYVYREEIDNDEFRFFKDKKPWDYINDVFNGEYARYSNVYGFVPLVIIKYRDMGQKWGASSFHAQIGKIHEINDAASTLNDQIRKAVNVWWYFAGVSKSDDLDASVPSKDQIPATYGPEGSQPFPMIAPVDIAAASANIQYLLAELERDMPVLALHHLREKGNVTAPGVRAGYSDAIGEFTQAHGRIGSGMVRANKMMVSIGGLRKYKGFESFNLDSFENGDLEHVIKDAQFVEDELSKLEKITALQSASAPIWLILRELDYDQETIDEVVNFQEEQDQKAMMMAIDTALATKGGDDDEDAESDKQAAKATESPRQLAAA
jgi:hypothetical protein